MTAPLLLRLSIPSPPQGVWHVGPFPVRAYALAILTGVVVATVWAGRRWTTRGGRAGAISDVVMWAVPAGLVGARIYHLATDPELYFVPGGNPWEAFAVWNGGLGIWGGVAGGVAGAWYACRRYRLRLADIVWAVAPTLSAAQAIGRLGTGSTRSSTAAPRPCRGRYRSTPLTDPRPARWPPPTSRRSSMNWSGTSGSPP